MNEEGRANGKRVGGLAWSLLGSYSRLRDDFRGQHNLKLRARADVSGRCWELFVTLCQISSPDLGYTQKPGHMYKVEARYHKAGSGGQGKILVSSWPRPREEGLESTECHDLAQAALAQA